MSSNSHINSHTSLRRTIPVDSASKLSRTEEVEDRQEMETEVVKLKCKVLKVEIIVILLLTLLTLAELILGVKIYLKYSNAQHQNYYEVLQVYVRNIEYIFDLKEIPGDQSCPPNMTNLNFQQINYLKDICLFKDLSGKYKLSYNQSNAGNNCTSTINLDNAITVNFWANKKYCKVSNSTKEISFYFTNSSCDTATFKQKFRLNCGTYFGYNFCMGSDIKRTKCPFFNVVFTRDDGDVPVENENKLNFSIADVPLQLVRNISTTDYRLWSYIFSFRLVYGNLSPPISNDNYTSPFVSYFRSQYLDFKGSNRLTVLRYEVSVEKFNRFVLTYLNQQLASNLNKSYPGLEIVDTPESFFSIRLGQNFLPSKSSCMEYFAFEKTNTDFLSSFKLFLNHVDITVSRYIGYVVMDLLYICSFFIYYRGRLIYLDLSSSERNTLRFYRDHEETSAKTKMIFSSLLFFLKIFTMLVQITNLRSNYDFALKIQAGNCFMYDEFFKKSLDYFLVDAQEMKGETMLVIYLMAASYLITLLFSGLETLYFRAKFKFQNAYPKENEKDKKKKTKTH